MADNELAKKIAEAKKKMFGDLQPYGGTTILLVKGNARVESSDPKIEVRKAE